MIPTSDEAALTLGEDNLGIDQHCQDASLGAECTLGDLHEGRQQLEIRYCACLATGGTNGFPLTVVRIHDPKLRALAGAGMSLKNWSVKDLAACSGDLAVTAAAVIQVAILHPEWTAADFREFARIEEAEGERRMS